MSKATTVRRLLVLNRASEKEICPPDVADLYVAASTVLAELRKEGLLKRVKSEMVRGGKRIYYRTTVKGDRVITENEKLLEEMFYPNA